MLVIDGSTGKAMAEAAWHLIGQCTDSLGRGGTASGLGKSME